MNGGSYEAAGPGSVAAHSIGTAHTGDVIGLPAEVLNAARDVQAPPDFTNLDQPPRCVGREDALAWLRTTLTEAGGTAITQASTVHGLGGVGKSTLALAYAHRFRREYTAIWWITADSAAAIEQSLAELARRLRPTWPGTVSQEQRAEWAMAWLQWHPGWLLLFDNVEDPGDLKRYLGALSGGHHLITSRRATGWPWSVRTYPLGTLDPHEATELICGYAFPDGAPTARERQEAHELAAEMGYLPLALEQAGAYLRQNPSMTITAYRRNLPTKLDKAADGLDAERTITRIWTQTLQALATRDPLAVDLLHTLAWLAPDNVPITLLGAADDDDFHEALGLLKAYSMATVTRDTVSVHRLVQTVLRDTAPAEPDGSPAGRHAAEDALMRALNPGRHPHPYVTPQWDTHLPHLIALAATATGDPQDDHAAGLYPAAARRLNEQGHAARAIPLLHAVLRLNEQVLGDVHPHTLASRNNLASAYESAGDFQRAILLLETTLTQREQVLGDVHADTLISRNNLAYAYESAGDLQRAIPLYETTLTQCEQVFGETAPHTLASRNNLAYAYESAGDFQRAIPLLETTLTQCEQVFGETAPHTLASRNNLAGAYESAGDLQRAIPLLETTLTQAEQVLGDVHPHTLAIRNNLAGAYESAGDLRRAVPLLETTLTQREQVLGDTHPHTLASRNNLAKAYASAGDLQRAIPLLETTLTQAEQVLGDTHPHTLTTRENLAVAIRKRSERV
ncbi:FxSxx-COOH system tetratricopeptide repeat protein [Kitasatospora putterlickiae]|uniref:FxSxx-COOH system tetratricopeptide repeat protein n=1 Tax=Kitasatospora putterlickiae TaxID=221725 RepID=A0ABP4J8I6_9ACTN